MLGPPQLLSLILPPISHSCNALSPVSDPKFGLEQMAEGKLCLQQPPPLQPARTCEDGLVDPQGGGPDFDDPDVRRHLVANCKGKSRAAPSGGTSSTRHPREGGRQTPNPPAQPGSAPRLGATRLHLSSCCLPSFSISTVRSPGQGLALAENHHVPMQCRRTAAPSLQQRGVQPVLSQGPTLGCHLSAFKLKFFVYL